MPYHERPFVAVSPTLRSTLQKSSINLILNSSPRSSILVIVYITSSLQKPLHTAVIVTEKDNTPFNYPILNSRTLNTVYSIDVYLNLDDCILHYSLVRFLNFVHIICQFYIQFCVIDFMFYCCIQYCNSVSMTCSNKRLLILSYLTYLDRWPNHNSQPGPSAVKASAVTIRLQRTTVSVCQCRPTNSIKY